MSSNNEYIAQYLTVMRRNKKMKTVSVEAALYSRYFFFVPVEHTVHDQSGAPCFIIMNREEAIRLTCEHYGFVEGLNIGEL